MLRLPLHTAAKHPQPGVAQASGNSPHELRSYILESRGSGRNLCPMPHTIQDAFEQLRKSYRRTVNLRQLHQLHILTLDTRLPTTPSRRRRLLPTKKYYSGGIVASNLSPYTFLEITSYRPINGRLRCRSDTLGTDDASAAGWILLVQIQLRPRAIYLVLDACRKPMHLARVPGQLILATVRFCTYKSVLRWCAAVRRQCGARN